MVRVFAEGWKGNVSLRLTRLSSSGETLREGRIWERRIGERARGMLTFLCHCGAIEGQLRILVLGGDAMRRVLRFADVRKFWVSSSIGQCARLRGWRTRGFLFWIELSNLFTL